jgi:hypothetical protein
MGAPTNNLQNLFDLQMKQNNEKIVQSQISKL